MILVRAARVLNIRLVDHKRSGRITYIHAVSAQLMRRILVERVRRHNLKRGRGVQHVPLDDTAVVIRPSTWSPSMMR